MATGAVGGQTLELAHRRAFMARIALQERVRAQQRKTVLMFADGLDGDSPSHHGVALLALRTHLPAVDVGVTVGALLPDIGEHRLAVALRASDVLVHPAQRVARGAVVELGIVPDRFPAGERVAVLARNRQRAVWAARGRGGLLLRRGSADAGKKQQDDLNSEQRNQGTFHFLT